MKTDMSDKCNSKPRTPYREAARTIVECPKRGKKMQLGHLRYKHKCSVRKDPKSQVDQMYTQAVLALENRSKEKSTPYVEI